MERQRRQAGTIAGAGRIQAIIGGTGMMNQRELGASIAAAAAPLASGASAATTPAFPPGDEPRRRRNRDGGSGDANGSGASSGGGASGGGNGNPSVSVDGGEADVELAAACEETLRLLQPLLHNGQPLLVPKLLQRPPFRCVDGNIGRRAYHTSVFFSWPTNFFEDVQNHQRSSYVKYLFS
jgi:hypothetical protein